MQKFTIAAHHCSIAVAAAIAIRSDTGILVNLNLEEAATELLTSCITIHRELKMCDGVEGVVPDVLMYIK